MTKYRVWWTLEDNYGANCIEVEAASEKEVRDKVRGRTIARIAIPDDLGGGTAEIIVGVDSVEEIE